MASFKTVILFTVIIGYVTANPALKPTFWEGTPLDGMIEEMRSNCDSGSDSISCFKVKVMNFLDTVFKKDNYQLSDNVEVRSNGFINEVSSSGRNQNSDILGGIENYIQGHDVTFKMPFADTKITVSSRNLEDDELNVKISTKDDEGRRRKSKLRKIAVPIMVFVLLKAITLIPLALGVLGLKAWNALQLGFLSFVISAGLAIFQLCKKLALDHHHHPVVAAHGPWDTRSFGDLKQIADEEAQNLAYNAYA